MPLCTFCQLFAKTYARAYNIRIFSDRICLKTVANLLYQRKSFRYLLSDGLCSVKKIETKDVYGKWQESWGVKSFFEEIYMLEPK